MLELNLTLFYMHYWLLLAVLHRSAFSFNFLWCHFLFLRLIRDYLETEFRYTLLYGLFLWWFLDNFHILPEKFPMEWLIPFQRTLLVMDTIRAVLMNSLDLTYTICTQYGGEGREMSIRHSRVCESNIIETQVIFLFVN